MCAICFVPSRKLFALLSSCEISSFKAMEMTACCCHQRCTKHSVAQRSAKHDNQLPGAICIDHAMMFDGRWSSFRRFMCNDVLICLVSAAFSWISEISLVLLWKEPYAVQRCERFQEMTVTMISHLCSRN